MRPNTCSADVPEVLCVTSYLHLRALSKRPPSSMFSKSLFSTAILVLLSWSVLAGDARCSFKPYGRPKASDCIFIINHLIPVASFPEGWVIYGPSKPYIRLPLVYYFRTSGESLVDTIELTHRNRNLLDLYDAAKFTSL